MRFNIRESLLYLTLRLLVRLDRRVRDLASYDPEKVEHILLVSSTALGDTVLSTAAMVAIRQRFASARITALIHRDYLPLFQSADFLDRLVPYHGGYRRFFQTVVALRREKPDIALVLHGNEPQATPLAYLAGAPFIIKLPNSSRFAFLLSNQTPRLDWADLGHGMQQRLKVAALAGASIEGARMHLAVREEALNQVSQWLAVAGVNSQDVIIGFQAGASSGGRRWPVANFIALARELLSLRPAYRVVILGAPHERTRCEDIARGIQNQSGAIALVAAGALSIDMLPALVKRCTVLVTGDTGTLHVAVAVGTPTVSLFTVSSPAVSGPAYDLEKHEVIHYPAPVGIRSKTDNDRWMAQIPSEVVANAVWHQLNRLPQHAAMQRDNTPQRTS